jgi:glycine cleavage system H protein
MRFPENLKYTKEHEWARVEGSQITVGITDHAQSSLGDVVYVDLPAVGRQLKKGETFGVVESIKAVSDLYAPVTGKVTGVNEAVKADPSLINREPQSSAWLVQIELTDPASAADLMEAKAYDSYVQSLG